MRLIKIGMATIDTTVGAFKENTDRAIESAREMNSAECAVGCFQEQVISGYPPEDLVQWKSFVAAQWDELERFAQETSRFMKINPTVFTVGLTIEHLGHLYNAVAVIREGDILGIVPKEKLPTYNVFYENRTFSHGKAGGQTLFRNRIPFGDLVFAFPFGTMAVEVCEDIWSADGPMRRRSYAGAELIVNASASPWRAGVVQSRKEMINTRAADNQVTLVYVNQVGGNDALVFDGGAFVSQNGRMVHEAPRWKAGLTFATVDLDRTTRLRHENTTWRMDAERHSGPVPETLDHATDRTQGPWENLASYKYPVPENQSFFIPSHAHAPCPVSHYFDEIEEAVVMGLDGYFRKTGAFDCIGISQSGGKDSGITSVFAWLYAKRLFPEDAKKRKELVHCISQPTRFNSGDTKSLARDLTLELGLTFREESIQEAFERELATVKKLRGTEELDDKTPQNIQARIRGQRMWNWANSARGLWIQTGNMSEKAVGYTTIGGDMMGGYALIANMPKTVVIEMLRYLGEKYQLKSVKRMMKTKASAELMENQDDESDLMPFPVLDACFALFAGEKMSPEEVLLVLNEMFGEHHSEEQLREWTLKFAKLFTASIFKWVQTPQTVHLGTLDLDRERALQLPVVQSRDWLRLEELKS